MAEEPRYTLAEAQREITRLRCVRDGHLVVDNIDRAGGYWSQTMTYPPGARTYSGPDPVERGSLTCRCGAYAWLPVREPSGDS